MSIFRVYRGVDMLRDKFGGYVALLSCVLFLHAAGATSQISAKPGSNNGPGSVRVCLRLQDESAYVGPAIVRLTSEKGAEITGKSESDGVVLFSDLEPEGYTVSVTSPGFTPIQQEVRLESGRAANTRYLVMKPKADEALENALAPSAGDLALNQNWWTPPEIDQVIPPVDSSLKCPVNDVLEAAGLRVKQFVSDLEKFTASERVEHHPVDAAGQRHSPEIRKFEYVVTVSKTTRGVFLLDEYRNGSVSPQVFPAQIATQGMPAIVLVFHPLIRDDFEFKCEGLGRSQGKPAWQVHFTQRPNRVGRILGYSLNGRFVSLPLKGRAWIDLETLQVLGIETELIHPLPEIALAEEHIVISYEPVQFQAQGERLWLPKQVELYVERRGRRYYRRHSYKDFQLFTVDTTQNVHLAKESYGFTNESSRAVTGVLTVHPVAGFKAHPVSLTFTIPAGGSVTKLVGPGKDIAIPADAVGSATFSHDGPENAVKVDARLSKGNTLDVVFGVQTPHEHSGPEQGK